ncbi:catalase [Microbacterium jiangjiandongii]|uniref:catalase n=1 Tax=Microbacterium jiangjiandongii TaxID=3049071 RepID=UPI00214B9A8A|nr:catalase [Microbacterium sp. zg.Y843]MCR2814798.1 catalase [Microbacterium sp. zg.Y843]
MEDPLHKDRKPTRDDIVVPGVPAPAPPTLAEPTEPTEPLPPKPDQAAPKTVTPTGAETGLPPSAVAQQGSRLTTAQGTRVRDTDHSLKAGARGPVLLQDHHLREKITHFDHERIPERVVHARGAAAHGTFRANGAASSVTHAQFLQKGANTRVFVRFSTVLGSRGSADTVRDTRGFSTKFYTEEGVYDLVANNIPVFFIQDAIKFPDVIHAGKPHPDREIPQAQSAHDTFWDFVSLHTEAQAHAMWNMSDRGIPRSYRMMEGFGVHTFRMVNVDGATSLVKFHWRPKLGTHALTWEEAQLAAGKDPDFHRRDLADAIESGAFPQWDLALQVMPDTEDETFEGIDLLDPTKFVPEELAPLQVVGTMTLDANPTNFFAETEQVAFHPGHLVPGIDVTNDPLLQGRLFSYLDTQISRLGGPNFAQLPINRPHADVNDMLRDGMHQTAVHRGVAPYQPNSLDGGCPFHAGADESTFADLPVRVAESVKERAQPASFDDHYSQARLFYRSLTPLEQQHVAEAYAFELGKCYEQAIKERQLQALANIDADLCASVADALGLPAPEATVPVTDAPPSPALSLLGQRWPIEGRTVGVIADEHTDQGELGRTRAAIHATGAVPLVVAPRGGMLGTVPVQRTAHTAASIEFDAVIALSASPDPRTARLFDEAFRHGKAIGVTDAASALLRDARIPVDAPGIVAGSAEQVVAGVLDLMPEHRVWARWQAPLR